MSAAVDLAETVRATLARYPLFRAGQTVVVAVSGGPDSTALLHLLTELRTEWQLTLVAAHLNHGFRGVEADGDADYVAGLCHELEIDCVVEKTDVPAIARRRHLSAQEAAREVRHALLRRVAAEVGAQYIALGHTRDDRVETILMNLLRGAGPDGLEGFPAADPPLIRPLYDATREQTEAYCLRHVLHPRQDASNSNTDYLRNRTRLELLPYLMSYYNENVAGALLRLAEVISAENRVLEDQTAAFMGANARQTAENELVLGSKSLLSVPIALQRRALRQAILSVRGHLQGVTYELTETILSAVAQGQRRAVTLSCDEGGPVRLLAGPAGLRVIRQRAPVTVLPWRVEVGIPGDTVVRPAGLLIHARICFSREETECFVSGAYPEDSAAYGKREVVAFRVADLALPLNARSREPGDRIRLRPSGGTRKLQDVCVDRKIPREIRQSLAVLSAADGEVLGVAGVASCWKAVALDARQKREEGQGTATAEPLLILVLHTRSRVHRVSAESQWL
jgi:tRNA(Ile)-lysidine synthase